MQCRSFELDGPDGSLKTVTVRYEKGFAEIIVDYVDAIGGWISRRHPITYSGTLKFKKFAFEVTVQEKGGFLGLFTERSWTF